MLSELTVGGTLPVYLFKNKSFGEGVKISSTRIDFIFNKFSENTLDKFKENFILLSPFVFEDFSRIAINYSFFFHNDEFALSKKINNISNILPYSKF